LIIITANFGSARTHARRRVTTVSMPVDGRSGVAFEAYQERTLLLSIWAARLLVTLTLPEHLNAGHVRFARDRPVGNIRQLPGGGYRLRFARHGTADGS
jgi:hypothetical protein